MFWRRDKFLATARRLTPDRPSCSSVAPAIDFSQKNTFQTPGLEVRNFDPHHKQAHSQQRTPTQYDMLPQYLITVRKLISECF